MSEPFLAEIRIVGFNFPPRGWAFCDGAMLPIDTNQSLYSLLGTIYGGDGRTNFALPDLRGRTPIHFGASGGTVHIQGSRGGAESVTLATSEVPAHSHQYNATCDEATTIFPESQKLAPTSTPSYRGSGTAHALHGTAVATTGLGQAHNNMQPYMTLNFVIALVGTFPSRA